MGSPGVDFIPSEIRNIRFRGVTLETNSYVADVFGLENPSTAETLYVTRHDLSHTGSGNVEISVLSDMRFLWWWLRGGWDIASGFLFSVSTKSLDYSALL